MFVPGEVVARPVEVAHIFDSSMNHGGATDSPTPQTNKVRATCYKYLGNAWTIIFQFGDIFVLDELNGNKIHRYKNLMCLNVVAHNDFDSMRMWLQAVEGVSSV